MINRTIPCENEAGKDPCRKTAGMHSFMGVPVLDACIEKEKVLKRTVHGKGGNFATFYYGQMQFLRPVNPKIQFKDALLNESIRNPDRFAGCI